MTRLIYGNPSVLASPELTQYPGMVRYAQVFKLYGNWVMPLDRTGVITTPIQTVSLFPMPKFRPFTKSYEDICNDRAKELLASAEKLGIEIYILYSGGIDSTCLLVSLLKHATPEQKKHLIVLLSHESIIENPRFYEEHIRGKLRVESSIMFADLIGQNDMLLSAEHNDLVMGNASASGLIARHGPSILHTPYDRDILVEFFAGAVGGDFKVANFFLESFARLAQAAIVGCRPVQSKYHRF